MVGKSPAIICLLLTLLFPLQAAHTREPGIIIYRAPEGELDLRTTYFVKLLELALRASDDGTGALRPEPAGVFISQDRAFDLVEQGKYLDIVWGMTSHEREQALLPVRIPLLKGTLGCRVAIIHRDRQQAIRNINSQQDLAQYRIVQGNGWPDVDILRANGLNVETSAYYEGMFAQIQAGRADLFLRGITEAWVEINTAPYPDLVVDEHMLVTYPGPIYFFVNRNDTALADRITHGLRTAMASGDFHRAVRQHPYIEQAIVELRKNNRTIIALKNPMLAPYTLPSDRDLWLSLPVGNQTIRCID